MQAQGTRRNMGSLSGDRRGGQPEARESQAGPFGVAERSVVPAGSGGEEGRDSTGLGDVHSVPHQRAQREREGDPKSFSQRMEEERKRLAKTIETGRLKDRHKMERRWGRIQASHPQVTDLYEVGLRDSADGVRLHWAIKEDRQVWRGLREGAYMLRTNLQAGTAEELWARYMQLTEAEASFRALKSELSIRPCFINWSPG